MILEVFKDKKSLLTLLLCSIGLFLTGRFLFRETALYSIALAANPIWFFCILQKANVVIHRDSNIYSRLGFCKKTLINMIGMAFLFGFCISRFSGGNIAVMLFASLFYICVDGFLIYAITKKQLFKQ